MRRCLVNKKSEVHVYMYMDKDLKIRPVTTEDLYALWELTCKEESPEWKKWDAPYFEP